MSCIIVLNRFIFLGCKIFRSMCDRGIQRWHCVIYGHRPSADHLFQTRLHTAQSSQQIATEINLEIASSGGKLGGAHPQKEVNYCYLLNL